MDPRDSIASSQSYYSNPYRSDLDYYSRGYYKSVIEKERSKDRIESSQQKIEEKLLTQFRQNQFRLPLGKFVIIGQIGKYIVLAIMLPPYIFFYGMPKWLLEQTTPWAVAGFSLASKWLKELIASTERLFALISQKTRSAFSKKERKPNRLKPVWNQLNRARENAQELLGRNLKAMHEVFSQFLAKKTAPLFKLLQQTAKIYLKSQDKLAKLKESIFQYADQVLKSLGKRLENLRKNAFCQFEKMQVVLKKAYERTKTPIIAAANFMALCLDAVLNFGLTAFTIAQRPLVFAGKKGIKAVEVVKAALMPSWRLAKKQASRVYSQVAAKLENGAKKAQDLINKSLNHLKRPALALFGSAKSLSLTVSKRFQKALDIPVRRLKENLEKGFNLLRQSYTSFVLRLKENTFVFMDFLRNLPVKFFRFLMKLIKSFFRLCRLIFSKSIYLLRLTFAWSCILTRHSWNSLKETLS